MRLTLRRRILLFTVLPIVVLAFTALYTVHRTVSGQLTQTVRGDLKRSSAVFENLMAARSDQLRLAGRVIVQDPRFFSVVTLPGSPADAQLRATVRGVAEDFNAITRADVFEVLDTRGRLLASVGPDHSAPEGRESFVRAAREGRATVGILVDRDAHYQVSATPVVVGRRVVGALVIGERIGRELAERLHDLTRSEVTFISLGRFTGTTLDRALDCNATLAHVHRLELDRLAGDGAVREVSGTGGGYLALTAPIPGAATGDGQFYVLERALDVETAFLREIQNHLLGLGAVAFIVALLAGLLVSQRITWPVRRLVDAAEAMERGDYDTPIDVTSRDEIGYLAERFGDMRQKQRNYVQHLEEAARLKSEFISVASHELRTPITLIRAWQELFASGDAGPLTPIQEKGLQAIAEGLVGLERIAEDATRMSQIEGERLTLDRDEHHLETLIDDAVQGVRTLGARRRVEIECEFDPAVDVLDVDGPRLTQALQHVIGNAVRFTPDGGHVVVRTLLEPDAIAIAVEDDGIGFSQDQRTLLEERGMFVRDSRHHHSSGTLEFQSAGLGLGLGITRGIVQAHEGTLSVENGVPRGTVVTIRLPRDCAVMARLAA